MDIAHAHTRALQYLIQGLNKKNCEVFNLGSGNGVTVLELIAAFEKVSGQKLNYKLGPRRDGDVVQVYANNQKAEQGLGWKAKYNLEQMISTAWNWELALKAELEKQLLN
jgi:UDP-glucose 4-epimerase